MTAQELANALAAARAAALAYEDDVAEALGTMLRGVGHDVSRAFAENATETDAGWHEPLADELYNWTALEADLAGSLMHFASLALRAFSKHLPHEVGPEEITAAADDIIISWDVTSPFFAPVFRRTGEHIATITASTRADVMATVRAAYEEGLSVPETAGLLKDTIRASSIGRARTIARTELTRLANGAAFETVKVVQQATEQTYYKRWLTAPGAEHPRHEDYPDLDGQTVSMDDYFEVGGDQLMFPGDPDGSPEETINCRCAIVFVDSPDSDVETDAGEEMSAAAVASAAMDPEKEELAMDDDLEVFADGEPNSGQCENCDHAASSHAGEMNDGACSIEDCECQGFEAAAVEGGGAPEDEAVVAAAPEEVVPEQVTVTHALLLDGIPYVRVGDEAHTTFALPVAELPVEETLPEAHDSPAAPEVAVQTEAYVRWFALLAPEGKATDDGRIFAPNSITWRTLPLSLMGMTETGPGGHEGAELCGRIDEIERDEENGLPFWIEGRGVFSDDESGRKIADLVENKFLTGNSVDLAINTYKFCLASDVVDEDGLWKEGAEDAPEIDFFDMLMGTVDPADVMFVVTDAVIGMSTVCPFPAFADATISIAADGSEQRWTMFQGRFAQWTIVHTEGIQLAHPGGELTASAAGLVPVAPPSEWFEMEEPDELTPLTVTDQGQVYGHAWAWDVCHIGIRDACVVAPHSQTDYGYYLLKECEAESGARVPVGTITLGTGHASKHLSAREAARHYDDTGTAVADITISDGKFGGWVCGALRPEVSAERVRTFRGSTLSGDWRKLRGNLELVGLLAVNIPGFPVPRQASALVAAAEDGENDVLTLIAAGLGAAPEKAEVSVVEKAQFEALAALADGDFEGLAALARSE